MKSKHWAKLSGRACGLLVAGLMVLGCSSDSPSEPRQEPPPAPPPSGSTFLISVSANPTDLQAGGDQASVITIQVRRRDNGAPPANGTTAVVSTSLGEFSAQGSGIQSGVVELINGNAQVLLFPGNVAGGAIVQARLENSFGQAAINIGQAATFFLSFVTPATGSPLGGDRVDIVGGGIQEPVRVTVGGVVAQVVSVAADRIRIITPPSQTAVPTGTTRPVNVNVTINLNETDEATDQLDSGFTYVPGGTPVLQPQIFSVSPASGVNEGGTRVTIVGDGFESPVQVLFGAGNTNVEATVENVSRTQIVVRTPAATGFGQGNQNQQVNITVRNLNTGFSAVANGAFRYGSGIIITGYQPQQFIYDSAPVITIFGQGFEAPVQVLIGGILSQTLTVSGTQITARAPIPQINSCANLMGEVTVTNLASGATTTQGVPGIIFQVPVPLITGVSPNAATGNTLVTVTGSGFDEPLQVFFGDVAGSVNSVNSAGTQISVRTPTSFSAFNEVACDDNADGTIGSRFVPTSVTVRVVNLQTTCEATLAGGFTFNPTDTTCRGDQGPVMPECSDGVDNDGDTFVDFPMDPQCTNALDNTEAS
ncbi:MAG TPA: IPT/TIG domain-containing protein [Thermoanaerobaculia bacterium]|nr:IPT/TIG domain-containing protein [Thermoanaerobaculia bacterium]